MGYITRAGAALVLKTICQVEVSSRYSSECLHLILYHESNDFSNSYRWTAVKNHAPLSRQNYRAARPCLVRVCLLWLSARHRSHQTPVGRPAGSFPRSSEAMLCHAWPVADSDLSLRRREDATALREHHARAKTYKFIRRSGLHVFIYPVKSVEAFRNFTPSFRRFKKFKSQSV